MNAAETIQAAIDKLEQKQAAATTGEWAMSGNDTFGYGVASSPNDLVISRWEVSDEDADLIVTLHRTIDAQLAILKNNYGGAQDADRYGWSSADSPDAVADALDLARAILGEEVTA